VPHTKFLRGFFERVAFPVKVLVTQPAVDIVLMFFREMTAPPLHVVVSPLACTTWRIFVVMVNVFFLKNLMFFT
jgi:hypothetical protein